MLDELQKKQKKVWRVVFEYMKIKGYDMKDLNRGDRGRLAKASRMLLERSEWDVEKTLRCLQWGSKQNYDWTLETLSGKKWMDFNKEYNQENKFKDLERLMK